MNEPYFLDTAFAIALATPNDSFHLKAVELAGQIRINKNPLITTHAVMLEVGNALSKQRFRAAGIKLLESLQADPTVQIVLISQELFNSAFQLYRDRNDKSWGLIDCVSFTVMQQLGISCALTSDEHFQQAGFEPLLK